MATGANHFSAVFLVYLGAKFLQVSYDRTSAVEKCFDPLCSISSGSVKVSKADRERGKARWIAKIPRHNHKIHRTAVDVAICSTGT